MRNLLMAAACSFLLGAAGYTDAADFAVDPRATYLRVNTGGARSDSAITPVPIMLADLGVNQRDEIRLQRLGTYSYADGPGQDELMSGVFSQSNILIADVAVQHRIPGAVSAVLPDYPTPPTYFGNLPTDIPEDFAIDDIVVRVPDGATCLFVQAVDSYYSDNSDSDGDFAVRITLVPEPDIASIAGVAGVSLLARKRRQLGMLPTPSCAPLNLCTQGLSFQ